jgi:hypothetical protein
MPDFGLGDAHAQLLGGGHHRPAAAGDDVLIVEDRAFDETDRIGAGNRMTGGGRGHRARALGVELVVPGAAPRRIDDIFDGGLRHGRSGGTTASGQRCGAARNRRREFV